MDHSKEFGMALRLFAVFLCLSISPSIAGAQNASGPDVGTLVEDFEISDQRGELKKLSQLLSKGPVALVAIRSAGWSAECKEQLSQLQHELDAFHASGLQLVGLSFDQPEVLKDFAVLNGITIPLLADPNSRLIEKLGILDVQRKKGTLRYRVAHPLTILIGRDSRVAGVLRGSAKQRHNAKQLIDAWAKLKEQSPEEGKEERELSFIRVQGNEFVDESGSQIVFQGLAIADPDKIAKDGHWNRKHFESIKSWGANLIRIPVHPRKFRTRGAKNYLKLLDQAVEWCGELEMYVIIDWHSIGNLRTRKFESDDYVTNKKETLEFWRAISQRFKDNPTIAFYEVFNEPARRYSGFGKCSWQQWKGMVEEIIDVIYDNDKSVIPLVAGFDWAYDLRDVKDHPIQREGVAYVTHPYPGKCAPPREPHWEAHFGFVTSHYPVIATEMGYSTDRKLENMLDDGTYRNAILNYLGKKKISWCVWVFDPDWSPALIKSYGYQPTHPGVFFRDAMLGSR